AGSLANASSVGANTVSGPFPFSVSTNPAACTAATNVLKDPAEAAISTMSLSGIDSAFTEPDKPNPNVSANTPNAVLKTLIFFSSFLFFCESSQLSLSNLGAMLAPEQNSFRSYKRLRAGRSLKGANPGSTVRHKTVSGPSHRCIT